MKQLLCKQAVQDILAATNLSARKLRSAPRFRVRRFSHTGRKFTALAIETYRSVLRVILVCNDSDQVVTVKITDTTVQVQAPTELAELLFTRDDTEPSPRENTTRWVEPDLALVHAAMVYDTADADAAWMTLHNVASVNTPKYTAALTQRTETRKVKYTTNLSEYWSKMRREKCRAHSFSNITLTEGSLSRGVLIDFSDLKGLFLFRGVLALRLYVFETVKNETRQGIVEEPIVEAYTVDRNTKVLNEKLLGAYYLSHRLAKRN